MGLAETAARWMGRKVDDDIYVADHSSAKEEIPGFGVVGLNEEGVLLNSQQLDKWRREEANRGWAHHEVVQLGDDEFLLPTPKDKSPRG